MDKQTKKLIEDVSKLKKDNYDIFLGLKKYMSINYRNKKSKIS